MFTADVVYDNFDTLERQPITRDELDEFPLLDENEAERQIFDAEGFPIPRRLPRFRTSTVPLAGLIDFRHIYQVFGPSHDDDDDESADRHTKYQVYPQAALVTAGHLVAQGLMYGMATFLKTVRQSVGYDDNEEMDDDVDMDWRNTTQPAVIGISSQMYNAVMHNTRGNSAQQHGVVLGDVTAALAGYWTRSMPGGDKVEKRIEECDRQLPHEMYLCKINGRPLCRDLRLENVIGITMAAIHPTKRTGRYFARYL